MNLPTEKLLTDNYFMNLYVKKKTNIFQQSASPTALGAFLPATQKAEQRAT